MPKQISSWNKRENDGEERRDLEKNFIPESKKRKLVKKKKELDRNFLPWVVEEKVWEKKGKQDENESEFKFILLDLRIENLGDLQNRKWRA